MKIHTQQIIFSILTALSICGATRLEALQIESLEIAGVTYYNANLRMDNESVVRIMHRDGILRTKLDKLPEDLQLKLRPAKIKDVVEQPEEDEPATPTSKTSKFDKFKSLHQASAEERYRIIEEHNIPNGGKTYKIIIAPELVNHDGIKSIIDEFIKKTNRERNTFLFIFDDSRAIPMTKRLDDLDAEESSFYGKSFKANYKKNGNTGHHRSAIHPEGLDGETRIIEH